MNHFSRAEKENLKQGEEKHKTSAFVDEGSHFMHIQEEKGVHPSTHPSTPPSIHPPTPAIALRRNYNENYDRIWKETILASGTWAYGPEKAMDDSEYRNQRNEWA